jgi:hypothetical protein
MGLAEIIINLLHTLHSIGDRNVLLDQKPQPFHLSSFQQLGNELRMESEVRGLSRKKRIVQKIFPQILSDRTILPSDH